MAMRSRLVVRAPVSASPPTQMSRALSGPCVCGRQDRTALGALRLISPVRSDLATCANLTDPVEVCAKGRNLSVAGAAWYRPLVVDAQERGYFD